MLRYLYIKRSFAESKPKYYEIECQYNSPLILVFLLSHSRWLFWHETDFGFSFNRIIENYSAVSFSLFLPWVLPPPSPFSLLFFLTVSWSLPALISQGLGWRLLNHTCLTFHHYNLMISNLLNLIIVNVFPWKLHICQFDSLEKIIVGLSSLVVECLCGICKALVLNRH